MAFLTLVQQRSPKEWKVPPTGSLLRLRALVLFHSLEQAKQSEASGGICWQLNKRSVGVGEGLEGLKELVVRRRRTNEHQCVEWEGLSSLSVVRRAYCVLSA